MDLSPNLALLPTELIESVASHLELPAFRSFRLTCVRLQQQSLHVFKENFFYKHTVAWNVDDFEDLENIASHPVFSSALRNLVIDATPRHAARLWEIKQTIYEYANRGNRDLEVSLNTSFLEEKKRADELAKFWNETRQDRKSLTAVFNKIRRLQSVTFSYSGMPKSYGTLCRKYCESSQNEMSRPFVSTMAAIAASKVAIREIRMDESKFHGAVSIGRLESLSPQLSKFSGAFENLHVLNINLRDWRHPEEGFEPPIGRAPFVVRFLSKCVNLRTLELSCFSSLEVDIFAEMAEHCHFPRLTTCKLELFRISATDDLFTFLGTSRHTLRDLTLGHIVLRDPESSWADLIKRIAVELFLERVELKNLFSMQGARIGIDGTIKGKIHLSGPGPQIAADLLHCAEHLVSGNWGPAWHLAAVAYPFIGLRT